MPFNGTGSWIPPAGQPVTAGTVISAGTFNTFVTDVGNTFNNVLPRDGQASLTSVLKLQDGLVSAPSITFNSESSTGMWRPGASLLAFSVTGTEVLRAKNNGAILINTTTDNGTSKLQVNGDVAATTFTGTLTGHASLDLPLAGGTLTGGLSGTSAAFSSTVTVTSGASQSLRLITSSGTPMALSLERSDLGTTSRVLNDTGTRWNFEHRPAFANNTPLDSANYNTYSPTLTGGGASGSWGISISGNAATATSAASCSGNAATATSAASCSGNAATATTAASCSGNSATATTAASCSGNAATATVAASCSGNAATATNVTSGSYTPTITNGTNVTSTSVANTFQWMRVGSVVTVSGVFTINTTAVNTASYLLLSLPVTSNFVGSGNCGGSAQFGGQSGSAYYGGRIMANGGSSVALMDFVSPISGTQWACQFTYVVI